MQVFKTPLRMGQIKQLKGKQHTKYFNNKDANQ